MDLFGWGIVRLLALVPTRAEVGTVRAAARNRERATLIGDLP
jgi:hypothetical protein